jgi:hypothetical protein
LDFVETYFGEDDLKHFKTYFSLVDIEHTADPIVKAGGLQAMLACFLKNNKAVLKEFKEHISCGGKADGKAAKKKAPALKKESSSSEDESSSSEDEKPATKKVAGNKRKAKESSSSDESSSDSDEDDKKKKKPA